MRLPAIYVLPVLFCSAMAASAATFVVDVGGSGDHTEIKPAMSAASEGDTILVLGGTYTGENNRYLRPYGKNLTYLADDRGRAPVVIDCEGEELAFYFDHADHSSTLVCGFTIINGHNNATGGAVQVTPDAGSPEFLDCTFIGNYSAVGGGAIAFSGSASEVTGCVFRGNDAQHRGGAIFAMDSTLRVSQCLFDENTCSGGTEGGGALYLRTSHDRIEYCTIVENDLDQILIYGATSTVLIKNCIIADSVSGKSVGKATNEIGGTVTKCIITRNPGGDQPECSAVDNLYTDPLFCDAPADLYWVCDNSEAIWDNNTWLEQVGVYGSGCPDCESPVRSSTWGEIKALYR